MAFEHKFNVMENKFEHLRKDCRKELPQPWTHYPVLSDYEVVPVYREGPYIMDALIGQQDDRWVVGVRFKCGTSGHYFAPGRKWGEFVSRENALLWALGWMLTREEVTGVVRRIVLERINDIRQLKLF